MAYSAKSQKKYNDKCVRMAIKYTPNEQNDSDNLKKFLEQTGQSANSYIKNLIKTDLIARGFYATDDNNNNDGDNDNNVDDRITDNRDTTDTTNNTDDIQ